MIVPTTEVENREGGEVEMEKGPVLFLTNEHEVSLEHSCINTQ